MSEIFKALAEADPFKSWWPYIVSIGVGVLMTIKTAMGGQSCPSSEKLSDRVIVVTNGTDDVSIEVAKECCARSATCVVLVCRDRDDERKASTIISKINTTVRLDVRRLENFSHESIRKFVKSIESEFQAIDVLINGESFVASTEDSFRRIYYGQLRLTTEFIPLLRKADGGGRIINVLHESYAKVNVKEVINLAESHAASDSFARAQLALLAATKFISQKLKEDSCPVTINACTIGSVVRHNERPGLADSKSLLAFPKKWLLMKTPKQGAQTIIYLAVEPTLQDISGELFDDCQKQPPPSTLQDSSSVETLMIETQKMLQVEFSFAR